MLSGSKSINLKRRTMKKLFLRLLFKLLGGQDNYSDLDKKKASIWLAQQFNNYGFREYYRVRAYRLLKDCGMGLEGKDYWIKIGQRFELLSLLNEINKAHLIAEKVEKFGKKPTKTKIVENKSK